MPRTLTATETKARRDHFAEFDECWMCLFLGRKQRFRTELHHIAGRGRNHEVRTNFCALCSACHEAIQSQKDAELVCLVLVKLNNPVFYAPESICLLRGRALSCWTYNDVDQCERIMNMMKYVTEAPC